MIMYFPPTNRRRPAVRGHDHVPATYKLEEVCSKWALGPSHDHVSAAYELEEACSMWVLGPSHDHAPATYEPEEG